MTHAQVTALYRYPVKSMGGETVPAYAVSPIGPAGDRNWAVIDTERRVIRNAKQWPGLLRLRATYLTEPSLDAYDDAVSPVEITSPDGTARRSTDPDVEAWLSEQLGRPVRLSARRPAHDRDHYRLPRARTADEIASELDLLDEEAVPDFASSQDELVQLLQTSATPPGTYVDAYPLHLVTQRSLDTFRGRSGLDASVLRFRPNLLVDVDGDDAANAAGAAEHPSSGGWAGECRSVRSCSRSAHRRSAVRCRRGRNRCRACARTVRSPARSSTTCSARSA